MASPQFVSPGALAGNAIEEFLVKRALMERQRQEDEFRRQQAEEQSARQAAQLALQQQQEQRIAQAQAAQMADLENQRGFQRATTIADRALPGEAIDEATAALLRGQGFGGQIQQGQPTQGPLLGEDEAGVPQYQVTPGILQLRGGTQYLNARAAEQARAAQAQEALRARAEESERDRQSAEERAREANETRAMIAGMSNQGRSETTALRNDLLQTQVEAARQKQTEKAKADKRARDAARVTAGATIDVLKQLADFDETGKATLKGGTANLFGLRNPLAQFVPGSETATAKAAMDRLKGRVIVDLLNEIKNQSRTGATGFGALSVRELKLLEDAASQLNSPNISDTRAAQELERIYSMAKQLYGDEGAAPASGGGFKILSVED